MQLINTVCNQQGASLKMIKKEEEEFLRYWETNRKQKRNRFKGILISLPLGIVVVVAIFINLFSGWYQRANMVANSDPTIFLVLLIAGLCIVAFFAIFSSYHKWDVNETRYKELMSQKNRDGDHSPPPL